MKVIFLDIDGVLNGEDKLIHFIYKIHDITKIDLIRKLCIEYDVFGSRWLFVFYLWLIVKFTNAQIVMSSSWRHALTRHTIDELRNANETGSYRWSNLIRKLDFFNLSIVDITPHRSDGYRGLEIKSWINNHSVDSFVILDDESFDIEEVYPNQLIKTSYKDKNNLHISGLSIKNVIQAIRILNSSI